MEKGKKLPAKAVGLGTVIALGVYLLTLALAAYMTVNGTLSEVLAERVVWLCAGFAAFCGAMTAARGRKGTTLLPLLGALSFWACVALSGLLGSETFDLCGALELLAVSALGALLALGLLRRVEGKRTKRHKTPHSRRST